MFAKVKDLNVHVLVEGPVGAPPLVLLHSLGTNAHVWDPQAAVLARSFRVIRPDLRGHGLTTCTPGPYDMALFADDLAALLDALDIGKAHIGGISIGGMIAQQFAADHADRTASLILCDTALAIRPASLWEDRVATVRAKGLAAIAESVIARWVTPGFLSTPETAGLEAMLLRTPAEGYAGAAQAIAQADLTERTRQLTVPALILVGDQDASTPVASAEALQRAIAASTLMVIPNAAHIPTVEQPEAVTDAITDFLKPKITDTYEAGMVVRKQVLGEAHVARATANITSLDRDFQSFITRAAWGSVWSRPGLDRRTRSLLTIVILAALRYEEELAMHYRASRNTGASPEDIAEALMHVAIYGGVPAANSAFRSAKEIFQEGSP